MTTPTAVRLPIPGGLQATVKFDQVGQEAVVVLGAYTTSGVLTNGMAAQWRDAFWAAFKPVVASDVKIGGCSVRDVSVPEGVVEEVGPPTGTLTGSNVGLQMIGSGATLIKWSTATGGRTGKGRTYLPGLPTGTLAAGGRTYTAAHSTAVQTAITNYLAASFWSADIKPAVLSFTRGAARPITGGSIATVAGVQRRRMR